MQIDMTQIVTGADVSLASRIAARRQDSARRRGSSLPSPTSSATASSAESTSREGPTEMRKTPLAPRAASEENQQRSTSSPPTKLKASAVFARGRRASIGTIAVLEHALGAKDSEERARLQSLMEEQHAKASKLLTLAAACIGSDVGSRLGAVLHSQQTDVSSMLQAWDKSKSDGSLRKMDFRLQVRKLLVSAETAAIDDIWNKIDTARSGTIERRKVAKLLKGLQERAANGAVRAERARAMAQRCQERVEQVQHCLGAMTMAEQADARLGRIRDRPAVESRLGALLLKRNSKGGAGELLPLGRIEGSEKISRKELAAALKAIGLQAEPSEFDELFSSRLDPEAAGCIDVTTLGRALRAMQDAAANADNEALRAAKFVSELRKAFRSACSALHASLREDEAQTLSCQDSDNMLSEGVAEARRSNSSTASPPAAEPSVRGARAVSSPHVRPRHGQAVAVRRQVGPLPL